MLDPYQIRSTGGEIKKEAARYKNGTNQRPPAERVPGPFEGPSSFPQLCWWSLIFLQPPSNKIY